MPLAPRYIPDGFSFVSLDIDDSQSSTIFDASYSTASGKYLLSVYINGKSTNSASFFEKGDADVIIYTVGGIDHYIMYNLGTVTAVWLNQEYEGSVSGPISVDEVKSMIDSIQKTRKICLILVSHTFYFNTAYWFPR